MTDKDATGKTGWVFYDADCPLCVAGVRRVGSVFVRRGYIWEPLQAPGVAGRLSASPAEMLNEMKLLLADGRVVAGADAWAELFRSVWWLWPLGWLIRLPVLHGLSHAAYRRLAHNRHCLGGICRVRILPARPHRTIVFFELP